jgi:hypothetical protein
MRPPYDARISDLGPDDVVKVECLACDHADLLTAAMLNTVGVAPYVTVVICVAGCAAANATCAAGSISIQIG